MFKTIIFTSLALYASSVSCSTSETTQVTLTDRGDTFASFQISGDDTIDGQKIVGISVRYRINKEKTSFAFRQVREGDVKVVITHFLDQSSTFKADVTVSNLLPSRTYFFSFVATTKSGLKSPPTREVRVDLLPSVPNVSWNRLDNGILRLNWNNTDHADETSYTIGVAKNSSLECGYSVTLAKCFGSSYTLTQLETGTVYRLELYAHSSAGRSRSAIIYYPE